MSNDGVNAKRKSQRDRNMKRRKVTVKNNNEIHNQITKKNQATEVNVHKCDHHIDNLKDIEASSYCNVGQELCGTKCAGGGCKYTFVNKKSKDVVNKFEYVPSSKNLVKACMDVNECDYALCIEYYTKYLWENESSNDTVGNLGRRRRSTS